MTTLLPAAKTAAHSSLASIAIPVCDAAEGYQTSTSTIFQRCKGKSIAHLSFGPGGTKRLLHGDHDVLGGNAPSSETDGRKTIRDAAAGRQNIRVGEVAVLLTVSGRTVMRLIAAGDLPASHETGIWLIDVDEFRAWLQSKRVPARWEANR